jgi:AcrR family transcriptional regulator
MKRRSRIQTYQTFSKEGDMLTKTNRVGRKRFLEVAEELFTAHGYRSVSIRDIAQACQVTNAALYYHFPSKEALYQEVLEYHASNLIERMTQAALKEQSPRQKVEAMLFEYEKISLGRRSPFLLYRRDAAKIKNALPKEFIVNIIHGLLQPLDDIITQAITSGELQSLPNGNSPAALLVGMLHGMMQHKRTCRSSVVTDEDISLVVDIFWKGLANKNTS